MAVIWLLFDGVVRIASRDSGEGYWRRIYGWRRRL